jgi:hypothetical protein
VLSRLAIAMYRLLPILTSVALLVAYGLAEGYWTDRWALSTELAQAPERLAAIPCEVGDWHGQDGELSPREARQGDIRAALVRRYANRQTGEVLNVLIVCGRPGPIAVHAPEVCLGGAGFTMKGKKAHQKIEAPGLSGGDAFWVAQFHKSGAAVPEVSEMHWSWSGGGDWQAVEDPRLSFARKRLLYKLYVTRAVVRPAASAAADGATEAEKTPIHEFLKVFLPEVKRSLFPG